MAWRKKTTPYEVMRQRDAAEPAPPPPASPSPPPPPKPAPPGEAARWDWWGAGIPFVIRLPRGVAVLVGLALVALIVLAYLVGHSQGTSAAEREIAQQQEESLIEPPARGAPQVIENDAGTESQAADAAPDADSPWADRFHQQARDGYGYLVVAHYPHDEAARLRDFLAEHGVAAALQRHDNDRSRVWCQLGFNPNEREERAEFRRRITELGRIWRSEHGGGTNLADAYWAPY